MPKLKRLAPWTGHHIIRVAAAINYNLPARAVYIDGHGQETHDSQSIKLNDALETVLDADGNTTLVDNGMAYHVRANGAKVAKYVYGTLALVISVANEDESEVHNYRTNQSDLTDDEVLGLAAVAASAVARFAETMGIVAPGMS
jgi:hypothetical protein